MIKSGNYDFNNGPKSVHMSIVSIIGWSLNAPDLVVIIVLALICLNPVPTRSRSVGGDQGITL